MGWKDAPLVSDEGSALQNTLPQQAPVQPDTPAPQDHVEGESGVQPISSAPPAAPAQRIIATTEDGGRIYEDVDGKRSFTSPAYATTDSEIIAKIMQGATPADASKSAWNQDIIDEHPVAARLTKFVEGTPFVGSYLDEGIGLVAGDDAAQAVRATSKAMEEENPGQSMALGVGGAATGSVAMGAAVLPKVAPMIPGSNILRAALAGIAGGATGASEGAIYGYGDQTDGGRAKNAVTGALWGGALGGVFSGGGSAIADGVERLAKRYKRLDTSVIAEEFGMSKPAARAFKGALAGEDLTKARSILDELGDEAMVADAGPAAGAMLDAVSQSGGQAGRIAREAVDGRITRMAPQVQKAFDKAFGNPMGTREAFSGIAKRTAPARQRAYDAAMGASIDYADGAGRNIEAVLERVPSKTLRAAIDEANEAMQAEGIKNLQIMAEIADDGAVTFREMPNVRQLDQIKRGLQAIAEGETDQITGKISARGLRARNLARALRDAVVEAVPSYKKALAVGQDKIAEESAFRLGQRLFSQHTSLETVQELMQDVSPRAADSAKAGVRQFIENSLSHVRRTITDGNTEAREAMTAIKMFSSRANREKLVELLGREDARKVLISIDQMTQALELRAMLAQNSKTAVRQAIQGEVAEIAAPNALEHLARGELSGAAKRTVSLLTGAGPDLPAERKQALFEEIARALTARKGDSARHAIELVQKALDGQPMKDAQARQIAQIVNPIALSGDAAGREISAR